MARQPLSILQVITQRRFSGAERICLLMCQELLRRGHRVRLVCKPQGPMADEARSTGIDVVTPSISGKLNLLAPARIVKAARQTDADLIHTHLSTASLMGGIAGRLAGIPVLGHVHALNTWHYYRFSTLIATCSAGVGRHLVAQGAPREKIRVVLNGIDHRRFDGIAPQAACRAELGLPADAPVVGCVAHLSPKKGQEHLLRAVALLKDRWPRLQCLLAGEGSMAGELERLARDLGIQAQVHLLGYRPDVAAVIQAADVVVLPSVAKEGLGLALVEAALLEKPTIGSNAPGIDEVIRNGETGYLVPPADAEKLAVRLDELLRNEDLRRRMGNSGKKYALETFSLEAMTDALEDVYYELVELFRRRYTEK